MTSKRILVSIFLVASLLVLTGLTRIPQVDGATWNKIVALFSDYTTTNDARYVRISGDQDIAGVKNFTDQITGNNFNFGVGNSTLSQADGLWEHVNGGLNIETQRLYNGAGTWSLNWRDGDINGSTTATNGTTTVQYFRATRHAFVNGNFYATNSAHNTYGKVDGEFHSGYIFSTLYQSDDPTSVSYLDLSGSSFYLYCTNSATIDSPKVTFPNIVSAGELMCSVNDSTSTMLQSWTNSAVAKYQKEWRGTATVSGGSGKAIFNPVKADGSPIFSLITSALAIPRTTNTTAAGAMFSQRIYGSDVNGTNVSFITVANGAFVANGTVLDGVITGSELPSNE